VRIIGVSLGFADANALRYGPAADCRSTPRGGLYRL